MIQYIANDNLDYEKWDKCIIGSVNGNFYAKSWYLDIVSPNWKALIQDDYKAVFPLPIKKRLGISYISQPLFTQQLGIFSSECGKNFEEFLSQIPN